MSPWHPSGTALQHAEPPLDLMLAC